ncbi:MAG: SRPBCC family protein [Chloroflexi bacterium]|nr:SRPBCC family protein [Chloroflexota bacterium]
MKNILDHRILIPKSPETVWRYLCDLSNNANWQTDCSSVSFLTSRRTGVGVRWRCQSSGHDSVIETTAWYDGLGYEYTYVDGMPFDANRGRIRLQEIPEGTVVQWTLSYDTKGFWGSVRNAVGIRRQVEGTMVESLRMLWRKLNQADDSQHEAKSLMRDAPGYEERARYKPRHPLARLENVEAEQEAVPAALLIDEPPVADDDTRPSRAAAPAPEAEPDFLQKFVETGAVVQSEPFGTGDDAGEPEKTAPPRAEAEKPVEEVQPPAVIIKPADQPRRPFAPPPASAESSKAAQETAAKPAPPETAGPATQARYEPISPEEAAKMDTREISVFEIFGLPKPSETQEMRAVLAENAAPPSVGRMGLRLALRRKLVKLRRPGA